MANGETPLTKSRAPDEPIVAFVHIPKTAGGTTISMLTNAFGRAAVRNVGNYFEFEERTVQKVIRTAERKQGARVFVGHVPLGVFMQVLPADTQYVTILRDPLERVLSHFFRHIGSPRRGASKKGPQQTLEEVLALRLPQVSNLQTRMLCNGHDFPNEMPAEALDQAKANLERLTFVGLQEQFNESLVLLQRTLGSEKVVPYVRSRHVGGERPSASDLEPAQRALLEEANALDLELDVFGRAVFTRAVAAAGEGFDADVETLRVESTAASAQAEAETTSATRWLRGQLPPGAIRPIDEILAAATNAGVAHDAVRRASQQLDGFRRVELDGGVEVWSALPPGFKEHKRSAKDERRRTGVKPRPVDEGGVDRNFRLATAQVSALKQQKRIAKEERRRTGVKPNLAPAAGTLTDAEELPAGGHAEPTD